MKLGRTGIITLLAMILIMGGLAAYVLFFIDESEVQKRDNTPAAQALILDEEEASFTNLNGEAVTLDGHFGKIIVVTSWASWCPECTTSLAQLGYVAEEFKDRGVVILAINRAEDRYTAERYLQTVTVSPSLQIVLDPADHYFGASAGYAMPETIVYTKDGMEVLHQRGNLHIDELKSTLTSLTQ